MDQNSERVKDLGDLGQEDALSEKTEDSNGVLDKNEVASGSWTMPETHYSQNGATYHCAEKKEINIEDLHFITTGEKLLQKWPKMEMGKSLSKE